MSRIIAVTWVLVVWLSLTLTFTRTGLHTVSLSAPTRRSLDGARLLGEQVCPPSGFTCLALAKTARLSPTPADHAPPDS